MSENRCISLSLIILVLLTFFSNPGFTADGEPARGKALFTGQTPFEKGGAPCLACHNLAGLGMVAGANYGPDLTKIFDNYGREGLEGVLPSLPFPSMEAIFADRPLTETEQADLIAFLQQTAQLSVTPNSGKLAVQVIIGVLILLVLTFLVGLRRMHATRQPLIDRQRNLINKGGLQ